MTSLYNLCFEIGEPPLQEFAPSDLTKQESEILFYFWEICKLRRFFPPQLFFEWSSTAMQCILNCSLDRSNVYIHVVNMGLPDMETEQQCPAHTSLLRF